jgi:hypothetical protein
VQVAQPKGWDWSLQNPMIRAALGNSGNANDYRTFIARLGVRHALLDNETVIPIKTFGREPSVCKEAKLACILQDLQLLDSNFTDEAYSQVMRDFFPSQQ